MFLVRFARRRHWRTSLMIVDSRLIRRLARIARTY